MDKNIFIDKTFEDVHIVIENYLNNGQFVSYEKWEELDGFVYEKYPFLSIAFLIKENSSKDDYFEFINRYRDSISFEVRKIKELYLTDVDDENNILKSENNDLSKQCESLRITIHELQTQCSELKNHLESANNEIYLLKKRNTFLEKKKPVINVLTKEQIVAIWSNYYTLPYINDNAIFDKTNFDIERFIEDLYTKFSIEITSEELLSNNSLTKVIGLLESKQSCYKDDFNNLLKQYPQQKVIIKEITPNNVTQIILSCCPEKYGTVPKYVFGTDSLEKSQLNVEKLHSILYHNFGLKESSFESIRSAKNIDELKDKILKWQNMQKIRNITSSLATASDRSAAIVAAAQKMLYPFNIGNIKTEELS